MFWGKQHSDWKLRFTSRSGSGLGSYPHGLNNSNIATLGMNRKTSMHRLSLTLTRFYDLNVMAKNVLMEMITFTLLRMHDLPTSTTDLHAVIYSATNGWWVSSCRQSVCPAYLHTKEQFEARRQFRLNNLCSPKRFAESIVLGLR